jgi:hypothetical protein
VLNLQKGEQHPGKTRSEGTTENSHTGHCTHTSESNNVKYKTFNMGNNITCTISWNDRIAVTLYRLPWKHGFMYIIVNTLHKGDELIIIILLIIIIARKFRSDEGHLSDAEADCPLVIHFISP